MFTVNFQQQQGTAGDKTLSLGSAPQPVRMRRPARGMHKRTGITKKTASRPVTRTCDRKSVARVQDVIPIGQADASINAELEKFELALRKIGANRNFVDVEVANPKREAAIEEMYALFAEVTGMTEWADKPVTADRAIATVIQRLRSVLGVSELTDLRKVLVARSLERAG